ncbi:sulfur carrier protein ThiS [Mangrovicoccus ximenensis]|uniref:sulfur carrier protein ThiS n=1 Tax=Mangrovicoccus ximenensis TaxID=1911570 RepID=UPI001F3C6678|nr:hypothetical protein [Mangrovicoccus ximenensis]
MRIDLNGESVTTGAATLAALVEERGHDAASVATALDGAFVPRQPKTQVSMQVSRICLLPGGPGRRRAVFLADDHEGAARRRCFPAGTEPSASGEPLGRSPLHGQNIPDWLVGFTFPGYNERLSATKIHNVAEAARQMRARLPADGTVG